MACNDQDYHYWHMMPDGSVYELKVGGGAGFAAFATFDEAGPPGAVQWPHAEITRPAPKRQALRVPGGTHIVRIYVDIAAVNEIEVTVEASVTPNGGGSPSSYCRKIKGANGTAEILTHIIRMGV